MDQADLRQLLNTSWTLHRLSFLHHSKDCDTLLDNPAALKTYAARLRDQLTGDVLAGIHASIGTADDDALSKTGALKECLWQTITSGRLPERDGDDDDAAATDSIPGILVTLQYENIVYKAALLADPATPFQRKGSTSLSLLLTRLPTTLRQTFLTFLSANFDTYSTLLRLPSQFLCAGLETYVDVLRNVRGSSISHDNDNNNDSEDVEDVIKELQLTLSFSPSIAPALRALNVGVSRSSLAGFLREQPPSSKSRNTLQQKLSSPLIANLTSYLETHLAMQLDLDGSSKNYATKQHVRLSKVACAAFVLGSEGRMKLVANTGRRTQQQQEEDGGEVEGVDAPALVRERRNQLALQAAETLLKAVIRRSASSEHQPTTT